MAACDTTVVIPQFRGTCWFNAILMMLTTGTMRQILIRQIGVLDPVHVFSLDVYRLSGIEILQAILGMCRVSPDDLSFVEFFTKLQPDLLLTALYRDDPIRFSHNPYEMTGGEYDYIYRMFRHLNTSYSTVYAKPKTSGSKSSSRSIGLMLPENREYLSESDAFDPSVLLVIPFDYDKHHNIPTRRCPPGMTNKIAKLGDLLMINQTLYKCESMYLADESHAHAVAGLICDGRRVVYDGNLSDESIGDISAPCPLFDIDWLENDDGFCLFNSDCHIGPPDGTSLCFVNKATSAVAYLYVKCDDRSVQQEPRICQQQNFVAPVPTLKRSRPSQTVQTVLAVKTVQIDQARDAPGPAWFSVIMSALFDNAEVRELLAREIDVGPINTRLFEMRHTAQGLLDWDVESVGSVMNLRQMEMLMGSDPGLSYSLAWVTDALGIRDYLHLWSVGSPGPFDSCPDAFPNPFMLTFSTHGITSTHKYEIPRPTILFRGYAYDWVATVYHDHNSDTIASVDTNKRQWDRGPRPESLLGQVMLVYIMHMPNIESADKIPCFVSLPGDKDVASELEAELQAEFQAPHEL